MIYITGDTHGEVDVKHLSNDYLFINNIRPYTEEDTIIVLGDFGFPFLSKENRIKYNDEEEYQFWVKWLSKLPCQILYIDGNHDNHPLINTFEKIEFAGGIAHQHPDIPNCKHLIRGEVYMIEGHTFLAFLGGLQVSIRIIGLKILIGGLENKLQSMILIEQKSIYKSMIARLILC